ncbi:cytochrome c [Rhodospirillaceae bacterium SYSU D60014]|uniref:c-type cytochrome n=1 Tax=Virgifigura deserti TaxID=2268457 RepID=UPI000E6744EF
MRPWRRSLLIVAALAGLVGAGSVAALALGWFGLPGTAPEVAIDPDDPAQVALGQQVYATHCAACHGANLEGQPNWRERKPDGRLPAPPHDASGHTWHHSDAQLVELTKKGVSGIVPGYESDMPAFEDVLTNREIAAVIAFIKNTWPPEIRRRQEARGEVRGTAEP